AIVISALIIFMVGFAPDMNHPDTILGTAKALKMTLSGFSNSALALVAAAMFIAAAMTITGLDKRIALFTMSKIGASSRSIIIGAIVVTIVLSLVVPSATARTACVVPIMMGVIAAFKVDKHSRLAASMMIVIAQATSIWNVGIQTSAAQNLLSIGFINKTFG
ncbi:SLC13 family permease, partial [Escherichia coli]